MARRQALRRRRPGRGRRRRHLLRAGGGRGLPRGEGRAAAARRRSPARWPTAPCHSRAATRNPVLAALHQRARRRGGRRCRRPTATRPPRRRVPDADGAAGRRAGADERHARRRRRSGWTCARSPAWTTPRLVGRLADAAAAGGGARRDGRGRGDRRPPGRRASPATHPLVRALCEAHEAVTGQPARLGGVPGATDGTVLTSRGGVPIGRLRAGRQVDRPPGRRVRRGRRPRAKPPTSTPPRRCRFLGAADRWEAREPPTGAAGPGTTTSPTCRRAGRPSPARRPRLVRPARPWCCRRRTPSAAVDVRRRRTRHPRDRPARTRPTWSTTSTPSACPAAAPTAWPPPTA